MRANVLVMAWALAAALSGCGGAEDEDPHNGWVCVGGCPADGVTAVDNEIRAGRLGRAIAEAVSDAVPGGTYSARVVSGLSGTATFTGQALSTSSSCGTDCIRRSQDVNVSVVFSGFRVRTGGNMELTLTGTATLVDTTWSRQNGLGYTSGGSAMVSATGLSAREVVTASNGQVWGEDDTVRLVARHSPGQSWTGTLVPRNGVSYSF
jgi:hypothetical protein